MSRLFRFKQFTVKQEKSAFKVGTDSVMLGAWVYVEDARYILDIGTGTGILSLMCAQKNPETLIMAIDIDQASVDEAGENFSKSPWSNRLRLQYIDLQDLALQPVLFDHIISNPPYFSGGILPGNEALAKARHMTKWEDWLVAVVRLLQNNGKFSLILPMDERNEFVKEAAIHGLHLSRECRVRTQSGAKPVRTMLELKNDPLALCQTYELSIYENAENYTEEYRELTRNFYLFF